MASQPNRRRQFRGSGLRYTLPYVGRFAGLWLIVAIAAILVAATSTYLVFVERVGTTGAAILRSALIIQTALSIVAVLALAVFTTHRLAGPWIAVRRALEGVRDGKLDTMLRLRASDPRIKEVERAFEEMMEALRRGAAPAGIVAERVPPSAARPAPQQPV